MKITWQQNEPSPSMVGQHHLVFQRGIAEQRSFARLGNSISSQVCQQLSVRISCGFETSTAVNAFKWRIETFFFIVREEEHETNLERSAEVVKCMQGETHMELLLISPIIPNIVGFCDLVHAAPFSHNAFPIHSALPMPTPLERCGWSIITFSVKPVHHSLLFPGRINYFSLPVSCPLPFTT